MKLSKSIIVVWICWAVLVGAWVMKYRYHTPRIPQAMVLVDDGPWTNNVRSVTNLVVLSINVISNFYTYSFVPPEMGDTNLVSNSVKMKPNWTLQTNVTLGYFDGTNAIEVFKVRLD